MAPKPNTILVIDDDADTRDALRELFELHGYKVHCAENGLAALDKIQRWRVPPALIVVDLFMPVMDGRTFLRKVREDHSTKDVPIIFITGDPLAQASGADVTLIKPLKPQILLSTVRRFVKPAGQ
jgi:CheY-like chemotaxis protein